MGRETDACAGLVASKVAEPESRSFLFKMAHERFRVPGEDGFVLNSLLTAPQTRNDAGTTAKMTCIKPIFRSRTDCAEFISCHVGLSYVFLVCLESKLHLTEDSCANAKLFCLQILSEAT